MTVNFLEILLDKYPERGYLLKATVQVDGEQKMGGIIPVEDPTPMGLVRPLKKAYNATVKTLHQIHLGHKLSELSPEKWDEFARERVDGVIEIKPDSKQLTESFQHGWIFAINSLRQVDNIEGAEALEKKFRQEYPEFELEGMLAK